MNKLQQYFIVIITSLILFSCKSTKEVAVNPIHSEETTDEPSKNALLRNETLYIKAFTAKMKGDYQEAVSLFNECIRKNPRNHAAMYELARIYLETGQAVSALLFAQGAAKSDQTNTWYQELYAETLAMNGNYKEASKVMEALVAQAPNNYDYYLDWAYMLATSNQIEKAIKVYDDLENKIGISENVVLQKEQFYIKLGKIDKAATEIEKLIHQDPSNPKYYGLLAELYDANNMKEEALKAYEKLLKLNPEDPQVNLLLADYYFKKGDTVKYFESIEKVIKNKEVNIDIKISILYPYIQIINKGTEENKISSALRLSKILTEINPEEAKSFALYGDMLYQNKQVEPALQAYLQAARIDNNRFAVWQQILFIDYELNLNDSLLIHSKRVNELFPNQAVGFYFNGVAYMLLSEYEKALAPTNKAIELAADNDVMLGQLYSNLGDIYHNLNNHPASDSAYDFSLQKDPNNAYVLNNYSYYLSDRKQNLEKAKKMSKKANELLPNNSSFLDTYGWIEYQLNNLKSAKEWLDKALENSGTEKPVVLEHYGDVLYKLGEVDTAIQYWQKAKEKGSSSDLIDKKIEDRKLYE